MLRPRVLSSPMTATQMQQQLAALSNESDAQFLRGYFKTGAGQYGEGDQFRGLRVPALRALAKQWHESTPVSEATELLQSPWHEDRVLALMLWMRHFEKGDEKTRGEIYNLYLQNTSRINNWDLVDASAGPILGAWLQDKSRAPLYRLAKSEVLWERRMAMIATGHFIRNGEYSDALEIAALLLGDKHDLMHKAVGWMLREIGKRDLNALENFLQTHYTALPRTALRYAIEKFPEDKRRQYLRGEFSGNSFKK